MRLVYFLALATVVSATFDGPKNYDGDVVLSVTPKTKKDVKYLNSLRQKKSFIDFWKDTSVLGHQELVHLPQRAVQKVSNEFNRRGLESTVAIDDLGALIASERRAPRGAKLTWEDYNDFSSIENFLVESQAANADFVTLTSIGQTFEERDVWMIQINKPNANGDAKQKALLDFNIHAREWITSATGTWIVNELLTNSAYDSFLQQWDLYIIPVLNPDGYEYSWTNNRLWRKTRTDHGSIFGCRGADPNRNWDYGFAGEGTSSDKCSDIYHGPYAFSELNNLAVKDFLEQNEVDLTVYINFHSYSQYILLPFGNTTQHSEDYDEMMAVGNIGKEALAVKYDTIYTVGTIPDLLYPAAGGTIDWMKGCFGTKWSYAFELRDTGRYGFLLPADQIIPTSEETLDGVVAMMDAILAAEKSLD